MDNGCGGRMAISEPQRGRSCQCQLPGPRPSFALSPTGHGCVESSGHRTRGEELKPVGEGGQLHAMAPTLPSFP